jgi:SAM-dependent methyltransferase
MSTGWFEFWNSGQSTFVSSRHLEAHYRTVGRDLVAILGAQRPCRLLDYGCGDALATPILVKAGIEVLLYDAVPRVHERLKRQFADAAGIRVLDAPPWAALPAGSIDGVLVNSVLQYLSKDEALALMPRWYSLLRPGGILYFADVVQPDVGMLSDAHALLRAALANGFMRDALFGLAAMVFSNYGKVRRQHGFAMYGEAEIIGMLAANGFSAQRLPRNIGFNQNRMLIGAAR